jgi:hypothetical protein
MAHKGEYGKGMEAGGNYGFKMARDRNAKMANSNEKKKKRKLSTVISDSSGAGY